MGLGWGPRHLEGLPCPLPDLLGGSAHEARLTADPGGQAWWACGGRAHACERVCTQGHPPCARVCAWVCKWYMFKHELCLCVHVAITCKGRGRKLRA